ncbi:hypothetical protein TcWFU_009074 [Taenia crassiceps]|uniref:Uncharacterized protein n=1 Tax=Taenia crassiceps TaxID=6207 RepID=A0ABR4QMJ9_9CEST
MAGNAQPEKLVHLYDELTESQIGISTKVYKKYLMKWGVDEGVASRICSSIDPTGRGTITREALCDALKCWPNQPAILREVEVIESDMSAMKRESIILLMLEVVSERRSKKETIEEIRRRLEKVYGDGWSCYIAEGRFCSHHATLWNHRGSLCNTAAEHNAEKLKKFLPRAYRGYAETLIDQLDYGAILSSRKLCFIYHHFYLMDTRQAVYITSNDSCHARTLSPEDGSSELINKRVSDASYVML